MSSFLFFLLKRLTLKRLKATSIFILISLFFISLNSACSFIPVKMNTLSFNSINKKMNRCPSSAKSCRSFLSQKPEIAEAKVLGALDKNAIRASHHAQNLIANIEKLDLAFSNAEIKKLTPQEKLIFLDEVFSYFKDGTEKFQGAPELYKIISEQSSLSAKKLKTKLIQWASKFLPGYELVFEKEVLDFKYESKYKKQDLPFYEPRTGKLDDLQLFELYYNRKIPILSHTDLISQLILFAQPEIVRLIEDLTDAYQRSRILGDITNIDQILLKKNHRPFSNQYRLAYLGQIKDLLLGRFVSFIMDGIQAPKMIIFGNDFLAAPIDPLRNALIGEFIEISLKDDALSFFESQIKSKSVEDLKDFLTSIDVIDQTAGTDQIQSMIKQQAFLANSLYSVARGKPSEEKTINEAWLQFSLKMFNNSPVTLNLLKDNYRLSLFRYYLDIAVEKIQSDEQKSSKAKSIYGPLFK